MAIVGSGNWGSAICKIVARNVLERDEFDDEARAKPRRARCRPADARCWRPAALCAGG